MRAGKLYYLKREHMGNTTGKTTIVLLAIGLLLWILGGMLGCTGDKPSEVQKKIPVFATYRDIPGVSAEEIEAIEALKKRNKSFSYGMILSTETFYDETGRIQGFSDLFCLWLSELFGIPFKPVIYNWGDLLKRLEDRTIDFTGELTATPERRKIYFMTDAIVERPVKYMRLAGSRPLSTIAAERPLRYAFLEDTVTAGMVLPFVHEAVEPVSVSNRTVVPAMLADRTIDAFFAEDSYKTTFDTYNNITVEEFFPLLYKPVSFATRDPSLRPVVSVLQKALRNGARRRLTDFYNMGQQDYMEARFARALDAEEKEYIRRHSSRENPVLVTMEYDNYPVCFYNAQEKEWQGMARDVLKEIGILSGLCFERANAESLDWHTLLDMLEEGRAAMSAELIHSGDREDRFLWTAGSFQRDNYALLSKSTFPDIKINEIFYAKVGLVRDTAYAALFHDWFPDHAETTEYATIDDSFTALERGEVDLVMATRNLLLYLTNYREQAGYKANIVFNRTFDSSFGFNLGETTLRSIIDKALRIVDTSTIQDRWTSKVFDYRKKLAQSRRPLLFGLLWLLSCVLVLLFVLFQRKRQEGRRLEQVVHDRTMELARQARLLSGVNDLAVILLESNKDNLKSSLDRGVEMIARRMMLDRVYVWRNSTENDGQLFYTRIYGWVKDKDAFYDAEMKYDYRTTFPEWQKKLFRGEYINGPLNSFSGEEPSRLASFGIKSVLIIPVFLKDDFWGFTSFDDCRAERRFSDEEESILRSGSLMIVAAMQRSEMARSIANTVAKLEAVISNYNGIIWCVDRQGIITLFNGLYLKKIGITPDFFEGKELDSAGQKNWPLDIIKNVKETFSGGPRDWVNEVGGRVFHIHTTPMYDSDDCVAGIVGTTDDITATVELHRDLENALAAAKAASRAKSDFLANMSHEIRTPMNAIIGMTSIGKSASDLKRKDYCLMKIEDASNHLLGVINDILDMSKIEANKFELAPAEFVFEKMLQQVVNVINFRVDEKKQNFSVYIDKDIPRTLIGDKQRLAQVLTNLLGNAVKFTPEHGSINLDAVFVEEENGICTIRIEVSDTGIGISREQQGRLFNSFQQAESSTSRKFGGTGLGLAISKRIVEMMGGTIWIESEPDRGSKFIFTVQAGRGADKEQAYPVSFADRGNVRILMVDDDQNTREYFAGIVRGLDMRCDTAADGEEALTLIRQRGVYDLYFLDLKMPGMDGIELTRRVKDMGQDRCIVIMISASEWNAIENEAKQAGVNKFLSKPIFPSVIADMIGECLGMMGLSEAGSGQPEQPDAQPEQPQTAADNFEGRRVLLVEDIEINREIVLTLLEPTRLDVDCAENGAEALKIFREAPGRYDMIFMDVQMPEMDGYEATRQIRAFEKERGKEVAPDSPREIPIIAMTANVFREDIEKCLEAGMNGHVGKPLDFDEVLATLRKYLKNT
jgi:signal transduction histidine kinase/DNA-binding response OmpR family regulator/ABC-type amino acid transport substrate-binding protein